MCSRFEASSPPQRLIERFGLTVPPEAIPALAEVRPTDVTLAIGPGRKTADLSFGLPVDWQARPVINARAEGIADKPTFRPLLHQRCIIPASAYFEWKVMDDGRKLRHRIHAADDAPLALAALFKGRRFVIVTTAPAPSIAAIHDRMPLVLSVDRAAEDRWLDPDTPIEALGDLMVPSSVPLVADPAEGRESGVGQRDLFG